MTTVTADIVPSFAGAPVALDGFAAGPNQSKELPFGEGLEDEPLHTWMFEHAEHNQAEVDAILGAGAYIMGRNMIAPGRGEWASTGKGGGCRSRRTAGRFSCSLTTAGSRSRWTAARRSSVTRRGRRASAARRADHSGRRGARIRRRHRDDVRHRSRASNRTCRARDVATTRPVIPTLGSWRPSGCASLPCLQRWLRPLW